MGRLLVELRREVDDFDCIEGAFLDADAAGLAETDFLGDAHLVGAALLGVLAAERDALFARPVRRTEVRALVATTVRGTPVQVDDGDTIVGHR